MPLHHHSFRKKLEEEITKPSEFEDFEKEILQEAIKRKTNSVVEDNNSIFDYENVIECVVAEEISPEDYNKLGLFPQSDLSTLVTSDDRKKAIRENFDRYAEFENVHLHGNPDKDFEGIVTDAGKKALVSADWGSNDFAKISRWIDDKKNVSPPVVKEILLPGGEVFQKYGGKHMDHQPQQKDPTA